MATACPHCGSALSAGGDAYCTDCGGAVDELPAGTATDEGPARVPVPLLPNGVADWLGWRAIFTGGALAIAVLALVAGADLVTVLGLGLVGLVLIFVGGGVVLLAPDHGGRAANPEVASGPKATQAECGTPEGREVDTPAASRTPESKQNRCLACSAPTGGADACPACGWSFVAEPGDPEGPTDESDGRAAARPGERPGRRAAEPASVEPTMRVIQMVGGAVLLWLGLTSLPGLLGRVGHEDEFRLLGQAFVVVGELAAGAVLMVRAAQASRRPGRDTTAQ